MTCLNICQIKFRLYHTSMFIPKCILYLSLPFFIQIQIVAKPIKINVFTISSISNTTYELQSLNQLSQTFLNQTNSEIDINFVMAATLSSTTYAELTGDMLKGNYIGMDLYMLDIVWPGLFSQYLVDLAPCAILDPNLVSGHDPRILESNRVNGKLASLPIFADYGILYYRQDILQKHNQPPPKTWIEMEEIMSFVLTRETELDGYIGQFKMYEGLTCNVFEHCPNLISNNTVSTDSKTIEDLERLQRWFTKGYIPPYARLYDESTSCDKFKSGTALFMRNWPFCMAQSQTALGTMGVKWGIMKLPKSTLGGWSIGVSKQTLHLNESIQALKFLTSEYFQKQRAIDVGLLPTRPNLLKDSQVCSIIGKCDLYESLDLVIRPAAQTGTNYLDVSKEIYTELYQVLRGSISATVALEKLKKNINNVLGTYVVDIVSLTYNDPITIAIILLTLFEIASGLTLLFGIIIFRDRTVIRKSSWKFCVLITIGTIFSLSSILVNSGEPTDFKCASFGWIISTGVGAAMASICAKSFRIYQIYNNHLIRSRIVSDRSLFGVTAILITLEIVIMTIWTFTDPMRAMHVPLPATSEGVQQIVYACSCGPFGTMMNAILHGFNGFIIFANVLLAIKTRNCNESYNESLPIGICMYTMGICSIVLFSANSLSVVYFKTIYVIKSLTVCMSASPILYILVGPKVRRAFLDGAGSSSGLTSTRERDTKRIQKDNTPTVLIDKTGPASPVGHTFRPASPTTPPSASPLPKAASGGQIAQFNISSNSISKIARNQVKLPDGTVHDLLKSVNRFSAPMLYRYARFRIFLPLYQWKVGLVYIDLESGLFCLPRFNTTYTVNQRTANQPTPNETNESTRNQQSDYTEKHAIALILKRHMVRAIQVWKDDVCHMECVIAGMVWQIQCEREEVMDAFRDALMSIPAE